ncbi:MAG: beta-lactamase family protein [Rhodobacteraceae bacterium]|nr:beta-lactamase family protein [Paracoccaceae bacterium]
MTASAFKSVEELTHSYVSSGRLAGAVIAVCTGSEILHTCAAGVQDLRSGTPVDARSLFRIYSMTKPITSAAAMMALEDGAYCLDDPVEKFIPAFSDVKILNADGSLQPAKGVISIRHLLCHTAGMTLPSFSDDHLSPAYLLHGLDGMRSSGTLQEIVEKLARQPVLFEPGSRWAYSMATDVIGYLVEIWSGMPFERFLQTRIFQPLDMQDTGFQLKPEDAGRMTANYSVQAGKIGPEIDGAQDSSYLTSPEFHSGAGGLLSTAGDYLRFMQMLINRGELDGRRFLQEETVALMLQNHLPRDMASFGAVEFNGEKWGGIGFGLGGSIVFAPERSGLPPAACHFGWTGAAGTAFFINPAAGFGALLLTQYMPSQSYSIRREFYEAVYEGAEKARLV